MKDKRTLSNVPREEIERIMNENAIAREMRAASGRLQVCPVCEAVFRERTPWQKFCTGRCRSQWFAIKKAIRLGVPDKLGNRELWPDGIVDDPTLDDIA